MAKLRETLESINLKINTFLPPNCKALVGHIEDYQYPSSHYSVESFHHSSQGRIREFIAGRNISLSALKLINFDADSILRKSDGSPIWPEGITGSISHKNMICGALVSKDSAIASLGFDIEKAEEIPKNIWSTYTSWSEIEQHYLIEISEEAFANLIFSAKEATFKAISQAHHSEPPSIDEIKIKVAQEEGYIATSSTFNSISYLGGCLSFRGIILSWCISQGDD